jgi:hypothetical protein
MVFRESTMRWKIVGGLVDIKTEVVDVRLLTESKPPQERESTPSVPPPPTQAKVLLLCQHDQRVSRNDYFTACYTS